MRPATVAELWLMHSALALGAVPGWPDRKVVEIQGAFTGRSGGLPARLDGWVYFEASEARASVCTMPAVFITGIESARGFEWSLRRSASWEWSAVPPHGCRVLTRSAVPGDAALTMDRSPSPAAENAAR